MRRLAGFLLTLIVSCPAALAVRTMGAESRPAARDDIDRRLVDAITPLVRVRPRTGHRARNADYLPIAGFERNSALSSKNLPVRAGVNGLLAEQAVAFG